MGKSIRCTDCHFLVKQWMQHQPEQWSPQDIENLQPVDSVPAEKMRSRCFMGVWDEDAGASVSEEVQTERRPSSCYYLKRAEGTTLEGGKSRYEKIRIKRDYRYRQYGLWLVAIGILVGAIFQVVSCVGR